MRLDSSTIAKRIEYSDQNRKKKFGASENAEVSKAREEIEAKRRGKVARGIVLRDTNACSYRSEQTRVLKKLN